MMRNSYATYTNTETNLTRTLGSVWRGLRDRTLGGTVRVDGSAAPTTGYMVGGLMPELVVDMNNGDPFDRYERIASWVREAVADNPNGYVGWWLNNATGMYHLDVSEKYRDAWVAHTVAAERNEIAVWDVAGNQEIRAT